MSEVAQVTLVKDDTTRWDQLATESPGPSTRVLAAAVARRHYLGGESKVDIAAALGISRFKVARLLDLAHELGIVRIEIARDEVVDLELSERLREDWGLRHCAVVLGHGADPVARGELGRTAAELLCEVVTDKDVLGLPWARSVSDMILAIEACPAIPVVQLSGSLVVPAETTSPVDIVGRIARVAGGDAKLFYAPLVLDDAESAAVMRRQPSIAKAMAAATRVTIAVAGIGAWSAGQSTVFDTISPEDRVEASAAGVIGEVMGIYFGANGQDVPTRLTERMVTLSAAQLRGIPEVIGIARGEAKAAAVMGAVRASMLKSLVIDTEIAHAMLAVDPRLTPLAR
jgi:DNA-binding transcriptional regulator LsrR (DeoR family)